MERYRKSNIYNNCSTIVTYYMDGLLPRDIALIVLQYSGHLRKGSRSLAWLVI